MGKRDEMKKTSLLVVLLVTGMLLLGSFVGQAADVVLNVAMEAGRMADAAQSVVPAFQAKYPHIQVQIVPIPYTQYTQRVTTELASGGGAYDVVESYFLMNAQYIPSGFLYPLDDLVAKYNVDMDDFVTSAIAPGTLAGSAAEVSPDGKSIFGLPYNSDILMMCYRADLYEKHGLDYPADWDHLYENMRVLKEKEGIYGYVFSGASYPATHLLQDFFTVALNTGGNLPLSTDLKPQMNTQGNLKALELFIEMMNDGFASEGTQEYLYAEKNTMVSQGLAAHMSQFMLSAYFALEDENASDVAGKVGYAAVPGGNAICGGWTVSVVGNSKHPEEAFLFIEFLTNTENNARLAIDFGNGPVRRSTILSPEFQEVFPFAEELVVALDAGQSQYFNAPTLPIWDRLDQVVYSNLANAMYGNVEPREALEQIDQELARTLRQSGY